MLFAHEQWGVFLVKVYKTLEGASNRARSENAHSKRFSYNSVRFYMGKPDTDPLMQSRWDAGDYRWMVKRTPKGQGRPRV